MEASEDENNVSGSQDEEINDLDNKLAQIDINTHHTLISEKENESPIEKEPIRNDENKFVEEEKLPIVVNLSKDIKKIIDHSEYDLEGETPTGKLRFSEKQYVYEYPREDKSALNEPTGKKKNPQNEEKPEKKNKKKDEEEDEISEEEMERLREARRRREEFAYLEKLRIEEEEEIKKQKRIDAENEPETKKKKSFKPKPKKKKGK